MPNNETLKIVEEKINARHQDTDTYSLGVNIPVISTEKPETTISEDPIEILSSNISDDVYSEDIQTTEEDGASDEKVDTFKTYMKEVRRYPRLKPADEISLGKRIFNAKLSLRTLQQLNDFIPEKDKARITGVTESGRGKELLKVFSSEISEKNKTIQEKKSEGEDVPKEIIEFISDVKDNDQLTKQKIKELSDIENSETRKQKFLEFAEQKIASFKDGNEAFDSFVNSNLLLVVSNLKYYYLPRIDRLDLIQFGNIGLSKAVEKFDFRYGFRFSSSAVWWIRQAMTRGTKSDGWNIKLPEYLQDIINKLEMERENLEQEKGRPIETLQEVVKILGISSEFIEAAIISRNEHSLEDSKEDNSEEAEDHFNLGYKTIPDKNQNVENVAIQNYLKTQIEGLLAQIPERERTIIEHRFGLIDGKDLTLEETGKTFKKPLVKQRVKQLETKAKLNLRTIFEKNGLDEFV